MRVAPSQQSSRQFLALQQHHHATVKLPLAIQTRSFALTSPKHQTQPNRILDSIRTPPTFHTYLQQSSASNSLLLLLFTTSACTPCRTITPLLTSIVQSRASNPLDRYSSLSFAELELDSPDTSNGSMMDMGVEFGVTSLPTLVGFGGRRAERVTERITDTALLGDRRRMEEWIDEQVGKGDPFATGGGGGGDGAGTGERKSLWARLFG